MKSEGAKTARSITSPISGNTELDFLESGYGMPLIARMSISCELKIIDLIKKGGIQGFRRGVLNNPLSGGGFYENLAPKGILILILEPHTQGMFLFIPFLLLKGGKKNTLCRSIFLGTFVKGSRNISYLLKRFPGRQSLGDFQKGDFSHTKNKQVRFGVKDNGFS